MSNNEDEQEDEQEATLIYNHGNELRPKTVGESTFTLIDYTDSDKAFIEIVEWTPESKIIEDPDSTEIISEEKNLETLSETNQILVMRYDELTIKLEKLTENYEKLTKETKDEIASLNKRIEELIESKVSISRTPSYWVDEVFSEEIERENVEE